MCISVCVSVDVPVGVWGGQKRALHPMELSYSCGPHDAVLGTELGTYCKNGRPSKLPGHLSHLAVLRQSYPVILDFPALVSGELSP